LAKKTCVGMVTDEEIQEAAEAFAKIIFQPQTRQDERRRFVEDFTIGARWLRGRVKKMEYGQLEQDLPANSNPAPPDRPNK